MQHPILQLVASMQKPGPLVQGWWIGYQEERGIALHCSLSVWIHSCSLHPSVVKKKHPQRTTNTISAPLLHSLSLSLLTLCSVAITHPNSLHVMTASAQFHMQTLKLRKNHMDLCIPGQSQASLWCSCCYLNDTDLIRQSRKLRCSTKCFFLFYELPCLTVPISKGVWPAFLLLFFPLSFFYPAPTLFLDRRSLSHTHTYTQAAVHTPSTRLVYH